MGLFILHDKSRTLRTSHTDSTSPLGTANDTKDAAKAVDAGN